MIGIDISKKTFDVFFGETKKHLTFNNDSKGIAKFLKLINTSSKNKNKKNNKDIEIVLEPTGGYENLLVKEAILKEIKVFKVHPSKVRYFAKSYSKLAKTDKIDASVLCKFGEVMKDKLILVNNILKNKPLQRELSSYIVRRRQIIHMLTSEKRKLENLDKKLPSYKQIKRHINYLIKDLKVIDEAVNNIVDKNDSLKQQKEILKQMPGIGDTIASTILAELPEIGTINKGTIVALIGLAPYNRDSGTKQGARHISGGRLTVRCALYMGALVAMRHDKQMKELYQRLKSRGKPSKVAIVAVMRKMAIILNARIKYWKKENGYL